MFKFSTDLLSKLLCFLAFVLSVWTVHYMYHHFSYNDWDLAFFTQAHWSLTHGSQYTSLVGINYFGDHSYYFSLVLLPVFALFPHPMTLLVLKAGAFALSGYLLYRILRKDVGGRQALLWTALYLTFPPNVFALMYEFNVEAFAPVFLLLMVDFFRREKYVPFVMAAVLLASIKENMLLIVFMFGLYALLIRRKDALRWAWLPMAVSGVVFLMIVFYIIPMFRHLPQHAFWVRYAGLMADPAGYVTSQFWSIVSYVGDLFGPYFIPAAVAPQNLFFILPVFLQHALSGSPAERSIYYHYGLTMAPFIFLAAAAGLKRMSKLLEDYKYKIIALLLLVFALGHVINFIPKMRICLIRHTNEFRQARWDMIRQIPRDAGVVATFDFLPALSTRKDLYAFHKMYADSYQDPAKIQTSELYQKGVFRLPENVTYALIDMNDTFLVLTTKVNPEVISKRVEAFMQDWEVIDSRGAIKLLRKKDGG